MKMINFLLICTILLCCASCSEEPRYDINSSDATPPGAPVISRYEALNGAVRIFYAPPTDADVISVDVQYTRKSDNKTFHFATSYFSNSILVPGLSDTVTYELELYAVDRAGNHSPKIIYPVKPMESAILKVKREMVIKGGFDAVFVKWTNELKENVNVFMDYTFTLNNETRTLTKVFSSSARDNMYYITDLKLPPDSPVKIKYWTSDNFGNVTDYVDTVEVFVLKDMEVPKLDTERTPYWVLPESRTIPLAERGALVPQVFGNTADGRIEKVIDGLIDENESLNYMMAEANHPWSLIIDLRKYYELSRIVTHQRHTDAGTDFSSVGRGGYYRNGNIGQYRMYRWDEETNVWELISFHKIEMPQGTLSELEYNKLGRAGDMAYMYPDDPRYTKPTRWFRYEALSGFSNSYAAASGGSLSEITLYCKPIE